MCISLKISEVIGTGFFMTVEKEWAFNVNKPFQLASSASLLAMRGIDS